VLKNDRNTILLILEAHYNITCIHKRNIQLILAAVVVDLLCVEQQSADGYIVVVEFELRLLSHILISFP
jgi:hypothetical protein